MRLRRLLFATLAAGLLVQGVTTVPAGAQGTPPGQGRGLRTPAADSAGFFPDWIHPFVEWGGGWLVAPDYMRKYFESGQCFALGLAARHGERLGFRTALDFQLLPSTRHMDVIVIWGYDPLGAPIADTSDVEYSKSAWSWSLRPELGLMVARDLWLTAGAGGGYLYGGFDPVAKLSRTGAYVSTPLGMRNGWGWLWTAAARWDFKPADLAELGAELRASGMRRGGDTVRGWSVRAIYYVPEATRHPNRPRR